jgi:hypothetical protein
MEDAGRWNAMFELWLADEIDRYLDRNPAPEGAKGDTARRWAETLSRDGRARLQALEDVRRAAGDLHRAA